MKSLSLSHPAAERLLAIMDQKTHWAYPALTRPGLTRAQHLVHFRHEYAVYVRDFPVLLARTLGRVQDVRHAIAENIDEEQTGGLSGSAAHPELFMRMMEGMGFRREQFAESLEGDLHPAALSYKAWLVEKSASAPWQAAVALLTIFVEGSIDERAELAGTFVRAKGDAAIERHPLVSDAWRMVLENTTGDAMTKTVVDTCLEALTRWQRYRDGVADRMGLERDHTLTAAPPVVRKAS